MERALAEDTLDVVGLARPLLLAPDLPRELLGGRMVRAASPTFAVPRSMRSLAEASFYDRRSRAWRAASMHSPACLCGLPSRATCGASCGVQAHARYVPVGSGSPVSARRSAASWLVAGAMIKAG